MTVDSDELFGVLGTLVLMSFLIERALAVVFEARPLIDRLSRNGLKEAIAVLVSWAACSHWGFDALARIFGTSPSAWGYLMTGAIVSGGSKASIKLFHDALGAMSSAEAERRGLAVPSANAAGTTRAAILVGSPVVTPEPVARDTA